MEIIFALPKSPHSAGRWGKPKHQDWFKAVKKAVEMFREYREKKIDARIIVISEFHAQGEKKSDLDFYKLAYHFLFEVEDKYIEYFKKGLETIEQLEVAIEILHRTKEELQEDVHLHLICNPFHAPRVWFLVRKEKNVGIHVVWGIPRPMEMVTDIILDLLYPIIELTKGRAWFKKKMEERRKRGKL